MPVMTVVGYETAHDKLWAEAAHKIEERMQQRDEEGWRLVAAAGVGSQNVFLFWERRILEPLTLKAEA